MNEKHRNSYIPLGLSGEISNRKNSISPQQTEQQAVDEDTNTAKRQHVHNDKKY